MPPFFGSRKATDTQKNAQLAAVAGDFSHFHTHAETYFSEREQHHTRWRQGEDVDPVGEYDLELEETAVLEGVRWFNDRRYESPHKKGFANPKDYPDIRDDKAALKTLMLKILDIGPHWVGHGGHGDNSAVMHPAEYLSWLYQNSSYAPFKGALEETAVSLLRQELTLQFTPLDVEKHSKRQSKTETSTLYLDNTVSMALYRLGIQYNCPAADQPFRAKLVEELTKTERFITLKEVLSTYAGDKDELQRKFEAGEFSTVRVTHPNELPGDFKKEISQWLEYRSGRQKAEEEYSLQLTRFIGLLTLLGEIGSSKNLTANVYPLLQERLKAGFLGDITYRRSGVELEPFFLLARATAVTQPLSTQAAEDWLEILSTTSEPARAMFSVSAGLAASSDKSSRLEFIVKALAILKRRFQKIDLNHASHIAGFIDERNVGDDIAQIAAVSLDKKRHTYGYFDRSDFSLAMVRRELSSDYSQFSITKISAEGSSTAVCTFDPSSGRLDGGTLQHRQALTRHLDEIGIPLGASLTLTSFESRMVGAHSKLFSGLTAPANAVEGILGLSSVHVYFLYDPSAKKISYALPDIPTECFLFRKSSSAGDRTWGFEDPKKMVNGSSLLSADKLIEDVKSRSKSARKRGMLGDSIYLLEAAISSEGLEIANRVIQARAETATTIH